MNAERFSVVALSLLLVWMVALLAVACASLERKRERKEPPVFFLFFFSLPKREGRREKKTLSPLFLHPLPIRKNTPPPHQTAAGLKEVKWHAKIIRL